MPRATNIANPSSAVKSNPNFDKQYFIREMERLDWMDYEDISTLDYITFFEQADRIRVFSNDPSKNLKMIRSGT